MRFLSAQSDSQYNLWQLKVQMFNFNKFGIEDKAIILIGYNPQIGISDAAREFKNSTSANVIFLPDERDLSDRLYTSSIRPHLIKQVYKEHPTLLENRAVLFHDCDVIFIKLPNVKELISTRKIYVSDVSSLLKTQIEPTLLKEMCRIVGIPFSMVVKNLNLTGGAQYLFNSSLNFSYDFWDKIEQDSNALYKLLLVSTEKYGSEMAIKSWSADLWAILWNIWLLGIDSEICSELSFTIASTSIEQLEENNIYHNAGVNETNSSYLFDKRKYTDISPFNVDPLSINKNYCSSFYVKEIIESAKYEK